MPDQRAGTGLQKGRVLPGFGDAHRDETEPSLGCYDPESSGWQLLTL
jgi:hypothetical protein